MLPHGHLYETFSAPPTSTTLKRGVRRSVTISIVALPGIFETSNFGMVLTSLLGILIAFGCFRAARARSASQRA